MTIPGDLQIKAGKEVLIEMTDNLNLKIISPSEDKHIFINLTDDEAWAVCDKVLAYYERKGWLRRVEA